MAKGGRIIIQNLNENVVGSGNETPLFVARLGNFLCAAQSADSRICPVLMNQTGQKTLEFQSQGVTSTWAK